MLSRWDELAGVCPDLAKACVRMRDGPTVGCASLCWCGPGLRPGVVWLAPGVRVHACLCLQDATTARLAVRVCRHLTAAAAATAAGHHHHRVLTMPDSTAHVARRHGCCWLLAHRPASKAWLSAPPWMTDIVTSGAENTRRPPRHRARSAWPAVCSLLNCAVASSLI